MSVLAVDVGGTHVKILATGQKERREFASGPALTAKQMVDGVVEPMELGHLPYRKGTYEDYVGLRGLTDHGEKKWRKHVEDVIERLVAALEPDDVVLGGGNVKHLDELPPGCRVGDNANAFLGGFRAWEEETGKESKARRKPTPPARGVA